MTRVAGLLATSLIVASLAACGAEYPDLGTQTAAIVGGEPENDPDRASIGIVRILHFGSFICTGTMVGSNAQPYVLTAAHCLRDPETRTPWNPENVSIEFKGDTFGAKRLNPHPNEDAENYQNDIGIIQLHRWPPGARPAQLARAQPLTGMQVTVIGYGATESSPPGSSLNSANTVIRQVRGAGYDLVSPKGTLTETGAFCGGDSGGPTFTTFFGPPTLIGVHSAIKTTKFDVDDDVDTDSSNVDLCGKSETFDVNVPFYLRDEWIWETTESNLNTYEDGGTDPGPGTGGGTRGKDVRAMVCGYTEAPPSGSVVALALLGLAASLRRRRRRGCRGTLLIDSRAR